MRQPRPVIAAILLLLPVLYLGSYLALARPWDDNGERSFTYGFQSWESEKFAHRFYWPLEEMDKRLRPKRWTFDPFAVLSTKAALAKV